MSLVGSVFSCSATAAIVASARAREFVTRIAGELGPC